MKIQSNTGSSTTAISLDSDDGQCSAASLLFSQLIPLIDALQKMPENRQENATLLPLSELPEEITRQAAPEVPAVLMNATTFESDAFAPTISSALNERSRSASLQAFTRLPPGDISKPGSLMALNPLHDNPLVISCNDEISDSTEIAKDSVVGVSQMLEMMPQSVFMPREKMRSALEIKTTLHQSEQMVKEMDLLISPEILSLPPEVKPAELIELQKTEPIIFSTQINAMIEAEVAPANPSAEVVINTMVDFINKKS